MFVDVICAVFESRTHTFSRILEQYSRKLRIDFSHKIFPVNYSHRCFIVVLLKSEDINKLSNEFEITNLRAYSKMCSSYTADNDTQLNSLRGTSVK